MFRQPKRRTAHRKNFAEVQVGSVAYPNRLSFYPVAPLGEITVDEFEEWAIDRLKILVEIESCALRGKTLKETEQILKPLLVKHLPLSSASRGSVATEAERRKDHYSHYILRLAFCRSEELRTRFVKAETTLFKIRYNSVDAAERAAFISELRLNWTPVTPEEKAELSESLFAASYPRLLSHLHATADHPSASDVRAFFDRQAFFKVPFRQVTELVSSRSVFLRHGVAYVPTSSQLSLLVAEYATQLATALSSLVKTVPKLDEDDRLVPVLNHLSSGYASSTYTPQTPSGSAEGLTAASVCSPETQRHFPLCMRRLHSGLTAHHHLRYTGRQQYNLFLKGIGLSVDEAVAFWQQQFCSGGAVTPDRFNREYKYNIRHNYGLEGKRVSYRPWDCATILKQPRPGPNEYHGCPYRDLSVEKLTAEVAQLGVAESEIGGVVELAKSGAYTVACTKVFELTHQMESGHQLHISHPNLYFDRSYLGRENEGK